MKGKYTVMRDRPREFFNLIPQEGVTHTLALDDPAHNAVWDMAVSPEGRIFFSVCGESYQALYARLYEYDRKTKSLIRHIELEKKILMAPAALRTSKFHTALSFIGDGKILTATHTTSPAPTHPTWMPYEYADHAYEGYPGSDLLIYDYNTGECRGLGRISPHDTVYGATYDPKNGDYLAITWMRGTGYVYNVHTGDIRCLGQISDTHTSRTFLCSDGHIYGSTYSGAMFRYNTDLRDIEWLGVDAHGLIRHARELDGKLYYTTGPCSVPGRGQELYAYDFKENRVEVVGRPVPKAEPLDGDPSVFYNAYGMAFDSKKRLWYGCMTFIPNHRYVGARLYMWDFLAGKEPVDCGFLGSEKRTLSITAEMHIVDDVLYISDGNHTSFCDTPAGIIAIELDKFTAALDKNAPRIASHDFVNYLPYQAEARDFYPLDDFDECMRRYDEYYEGTVLKFKKFTADNAYRLPASGCVGISLWERLGRGKAAIGEITWEGDERLSLLVGEDLATRVTCSFDGVRATVTEITEAAPAARHGRAAELPALPLPAVPGRQYLATAECALRLASGRWLVGTRDSMLAIVDGESVFSLGAIPGHGGIHALSQAPDGRVFGVAGHPLGCGQIFSFTEREGVRLLGLVPEVFAEGGRQTAIYRPTAVAVSPSGKWLAIGGADEMGGVVILPI